MTLLQIAASSGEFSLSKLDEFLQHLIALGVDVGRKIIVATIVYIVGHYIVKLLNRLIGKALSTSRMEPNVQTFLRSAVNILLTTLLCITVISALGVNTTSFAAIIASAGVAIGMALSGNLQNVAGGIIILLFKPYRVGDWIESHDYQGRVREVQMFHTIIQTVDNRVVYIPNGTMSNSLVVNYDLLPLRRVQWEVSISYGDDVSHAREVLKGVVEADPRILTQPKDQKGKELKPFYVGVREMGASSINLVVRAYAKTEDYWEVLYDLNEKFYQAIDADPSLTIPFQTHTVHVVKE